jgi:hypothetical protein
MHDLDGVARLCAADHAPICIRLSSWHPSSRKSGQSYRPECAQTMQTDDLDEVDFSLNFMIQYVRSFGVRGAQLERLFEEKLQAAYAIADQFDESLGDVIAESSSKSTH